MGKLTVKNIVEVTKATEIYNLANAIRSSALKHYQEYIPVANQTNIAEFYNSIVNLQQQNTFVQALVNRIGLTIVKSASLSNPLAKFKMGKTVLGDTIQEIFIDLTDAHKFNPEIAETEVYKREMPNVHVLYHKLNRKVFYKQTISEDELHAAFVSWDAFGSFVVKITQVLVNSNEVDEYLHMKMLFDVAASKGWFTEIDVYSGNNAESLKYLVAQARAAFTRITMPQGTRDFNSLYVRTKSDPSDIYVFVTPEKYAALNVEVLAQAFNMNRADFLGQVMVVESLPPGYEMIMIDASFFVVSDNTYKMKTKENEQGLYWNYWLHVWQTISCTRFANAVAFTSQARKPITQVLVYPTIKAIKPNTPTNFQVVVKQLFPIENEENVPYTLTATFIDADNSAPTTTGVTAVLQEDGLTYKVTATTAAPENLILRVRATYEVTPAQGQTPAVTDYVEGSAYIQVTDVYE